MDVYQPSFNLLAYIAARLLTPFHICLTSSFHTVSSDLLYFILHGRLKQITKDKTTLYFDALCTELKIFCNSLKVPKSQTNNGKGECLLWPVWGMIFSIGKRPRDGMFLYNRKSSGEKVLYGGYFTLWHRRRSHTQFRGRKKSSHYWRGTL